MFQTHQPIIEHNILTLKRLGRGQFEPVTPPPPHQPCRFSKNLSSKERVRPRFFFVTFYIIISHIFPENVFKILQVAQKI